MTTNATYHNLKNIAAVFIAVAMQMSVCGAEERPEFPEGVPEDAVWLTQDDKGDYYSLTAGNAYQSWSGDYKLQEGDVTKSCFVPNGLLARATKTTTVIVPVVFSAGRINARNPDNAVTFNDLRLLAGGELYNSSSAQKCGNITILSEDPDRPARLCCRNEEMVTFGLAARVVGSKESQAFYCMGGASCSASLQLQAGSDWSGFEGTLRIDDGLRMQNRGEAPITMPGSLRFGKGGILQMYNVSGAYSLGNLSFVEDGMVSNRATLTVTGTFDTGKNFRWFSNGAGTFGTLILGDGSVLVDDQSSPTTLLTVTKKLVVGKRVHIEFPNRKGNTENGRRMLFMRLSAEAAADGDLDISGVSVTYKNDWAYRLGYLKAEPDPDNEGGLLVYAVQSPVVYYYGPDEWGISDRMGDWLDDAEPTQWQDGLYPDGEKTYFTTGCVYFVSGKPTTFPGKILMCKDDLCLDTSAYVSNLFLYGSGRVYARGGEIHLGGNLTLTDSSTIRQIGSSPFYLDSALHGEHALGLNSYYPDKDEGGVTFHLTADNSDWTGKLSTSWSERSDADRKCPVSEVHHVRIVVGDAISLGGNPKTFTYDSVTLNNYAEIRFTDTSVQTASNRGFHVQNGILNVDAGKVADLTAPVTLEGELRKIGAGTLGFGGGIRCNKENDLTVQPEEGKNVLLVKEGGIKCGSLTGLDVTFSAGTGIVSGGEATDLTGATVTAEGTVYLTVDANALEVPTEAVTCPVVKVTAEQASAFGSRFKAAKSPWQGWPVTVVAETDGSGNVTYSVKYEKKGFVFSIR